MNDIPDVLDEAADRLAESAQPVVPLGDELPTDQMTKIQEPKRKPIKVSETGLLDNRAIESTEVGTKNILTIFDQANPAERDFWSRWYHHANQDVHALADRYQLPFGLVAGIVAVLSPGNNWPMNLRAADRAILLASKILEDPARQQAEQLEDPKARDQEYSRLARQHRVSVNSYPRNIRKAVKILETEDLNAWVTGPKVSAFLKALVDPSSVDEEMVLDGHALNIWIGVKRALKQAIDATNKERRAKILKSYADAADARHTTTRAVQAVTWYIWKSVVLNDELDDRQLDMIEKAA